MILYAKLVLLFVLLALVLGGHFAVRGLRRFPVDPQRHVPVADAERGKIMLREYGCIACHTIPGVPGATGRVGPELDDVAERIYIAGVLPNSPQNLVDWIQNPRQAAPRTAMPNLNVNQKDARDIAAYLYAHQ